MNRRSFLSAAGAGAILYRLTGSPPPLKAASANDQIGLGFIGLGIQGNNLLNAFMRVPGVRVIAVADLYDGHLTRAKEVAGDAVFTTRDYHQVLARKDVDAVVVATPDHWHKQIVLDSLIAHKDIYIEKPMTWNLAQGKVIMDAVKKTDRILQVGSAMKTSAITAKARELIKAGAIGRVNMVRMANNRNSPAGSWVYPIPADASPQTIDWDRFIGPAPKRPFDPKIFFRWRCWWEYSGGVATDLFVHLLTTLHEIMDVRRPKSAVSQGGLYYWKDGRTVPDVMDTMFEYDGFVANMYVNLANSRLPIPPTIMGTEGTIIIRNNGVTLIPEPVPGPAQVGEVRHFPDALRKQYFESVGYTADGQPKQPLPARKTEQVIDVERAPSHYDYFIMSVRDRSASREDAAAGHYAAGAAHIANQAYRRGRRVEWKEGT